MWRTKLGGRAIGADGRAVLCLIKTFVIPGYCCSEDNELFCRTF